MTFARRRTSLPAAPLLGALLLSAAGGAHAAQSHGDGTPLTGEQIYSRVLKNRFDAFFLESNLSSGTGGGRVQETRIEMSFKDYRHESNALERGVLTKTMVRYTHPFDLRHAGYLVIQNEQRINDQFVYLPTRRRTLRVNLRGKTVFGTDFSFEDVIPRELQQANYQRVADGEVDGTRVYIVEATPTALGDSEYSRFRFYVDPERFVPLRTRYWNAAGVEVKELRAAPDRIEHIAGVYVPMLMTMRHLRLDSFTTLEITHLVPNPMFPIGTFAKGKLETH